MPASVSNEISGTVVSFVSPKLAKFWNTGQRHSTRGRTLCSCRQHRSAGHGALGGDTVFLRLVLEKWVKCGSHRLFPTVVPLVGTQGQAKGFAYLLELDRHWHGLTSEATPHSIHKGITTAIMNSNCLVFSPCCGQEENTGYTKPALRASTLRPLGS